MNTQTEGLHTKGEWQARMYCVRDGNGSLIAECDFPHLANSTAQANAELIVKAVNNFERMKEALEWLTEGVDEGETIKGAKVMHAIAEATTILSQLNR